MDTFTLYELNSLVSETISNALPDYYWVESELSEIRVVNGNCFMELIQKDMFSATPVAKASAKCWRSQWSGVSSAFFRATGTMPQAGMKLLARVSVDFHPTYGYSLIIQEIDPTYTLGDMARKRQEILRTLEEEGVLDLQKELQLPLFCQNIAVISSPTAAGYGDFCNHLQNNGYGLRFNVTLFPAIMQGDQIEKSVCDALNAIYSNTLSHSEAEGDSCFSCVVIIRGGGAVSDMSGFDSLFLAENVANFPIPIITGIGHERDECVLDIISFMKVKTPTAAANFLIDHQLDVLTRANDAQKTILSGASQLIERQSSLLTQLSGSILSSAQLFSANQTNRVEKIQSGIQNSVAHIINNNKYKLDIINQRITLLDPNLLLKRGYSLTMMNNKIVKDASQLKSGDEIETLLSNGKIKSVVE